MVGPIEPTFAEALEREESDAAWAVTIAIVLGAIVVLGVAFSIHLAWVVLFAAVLGVALVLVRSILRRRGRVARTP